MEPLLLWATPGRRGFPTRNNSSSQPVPGAPSSSQRYGPSAVPAPVPRASSQSRPTGITAAQIKAQEDAIRRQESLMKAQELKTMLNNLEKVDDEGRRISLLDKLCPTDDILNLPLHPDPPGTKNGQLTVDLLKHQVSSEHTSQCHHDCQRLPCFRAKRFSGASRESIPYCLRKKATNLFNSGKNATLWIRRYVAFIASILRQLRDRIPLQPYYFNRVFLS